MLTNSWGYRKLQLPKCSSKAEEHTRNIQVFREQQLEEYGLIFKLLHGSSRLKITLHLQVQPDEN